MVVMVFRSLVGSLSYLFFFSASGFDGSTVHWSRSNLCKRFRHSSSHRWSFRAVVWVCPSICPHVCMLALRDIVSIFLTNRNCHNSYILQLFTDLVWGQTVSGVVERQTAHFFRIPISQDDLNTGVIINCKSVDNQDKFKVIFFDNQGAIAFNGFMINERMTLFRAYDLKHAAAFLQVTWHWWKRVNGGSVTRKRSCTSCPTDDTICQNLPCHSTWWKDWMMTFPPVWSASWSLLAPVVFIVVSLRSKHVVVDDSAVAWFRFGTISLQFSWFSTLTIETSSLSFLAPISFASTVTIGFSRWSILSDPSLRSHPSQVNSGALT